MMYAIGENRIGDVIGVDLDALIGAHLCVSANSGGGKSGLIRKILETTYGHVQHIILDAEDEFYTLRERFDYVIAGGEDGDAPATVANAKDLAQAALEANFSLIAQINDLGVDAGTFIASFLDALIAAPKHLWRPLLVVIDEAQRFAPNNGSNAASSRAIKDLMQRGRKRGYTAVVATTKFSELDAGVRGQCRNWMLGLVGTALDKRTVGEQMGFPPSSNEAKGLQRLEPRQFWGYGPAISREPILFTVGDVETTIVKAGQAHVPTPPAPEALREILAALAQPKSDVSDTSNSSDVEAERAHWNMTMADRNEEIAQLRQRLAELEARENREDELHQVIAGYQRAFQAQATLVADISWPSIERRDGTMPHEPLVIPPVVKDPALHGGDKRRLAPTQDEAGSRDAVVGPGPASSGSIARLASSLLPMTRRLVDTIARFYPRSLSIEHCAKIGGVGIKSSQWSRHFREFKESGLVEQMANGEWKLSDAGVVELGAQAAPAAADALLAFWRQSLPPSTGNMLAVMVEARGEWLSRDEIAQRAGVSVTSSSLGAGLKELRDHGLAERAHDGAHRATQALL